MGTDINTFVPNYIKQTENKTTQETITHERWNELWNLGIIQGDDNAETIYTLCQEVINRYTKDQINSMVVDSSGASLVGVSPTAPFETATNVMTLIQALITRLQATTDSGSGADFVGSTAITGVTGTTVQAQLESLKVIADDLQTQITGAATIPNLHADTVDMKHASDIIAEANTYTDDQINTVLSTGVPKLYTYPIPLQATQAGQTVFPFVLASFDIATDTVLVYKNTVYVPPAEYTIVNAAGGGQLTLTTGVANGTYIDLLIMKNVPAGPEGTTSGAVLTPNTVSIDRLVQAELGAANGLATLGADGLLPAAQLPVKMITGSYTGDSVNGRAINLGFAPKFVVINSNSSYVHTAVPGYSVTHVPTSSGTAHQYPNCVTLTATGFTVDGTYANYNGTGYYYFAIG